MVKPKGETVLDPEAEESINQITEGLGQYLRILLRRNPKIQAEKKKKDGERAESG
jgi:cell division protein ZapA (FtsZ GTPase activity inhibitor)